MRLSSLGIDKECMVHLRFRVADSGPVREQIFYSSTLSGVSVSNSGSYLADLNGTAGQLFNELTSRHGILPSQKCYLAHNGRTIATGGPGWFNFEGATDSDFSSKTLKNLGIERESWVFLCIE